MRTVTARAGFLGVVAVLTCATPAWAIEPLVTDFGIGTLLHPIEEPPDAQSPVPHAGKDHVHIFAVNGLNPLCLGNFNGLCGYLKKQGYRNTRFEQLYTCFRCAGQIREVRKSDPRAKIVLIGFSLGANSVKSIAHDLARDGTRVDLLVYLVGDLIKNTPDSRPDNVARVVNVRAQGLVLIGGDLLFPGEELAGARNQRLECRHILVPSRRETLELMTQELQLLAGQSAPARMPARIAAMMPAGRR